MLRKWYYTNAGNEHIWPILRIVSTSTWGMRANTVVTSVPTVPTCRADGAEKDKPRFVTGAGSLATFFRATCWNRCRTDSKSRGQDLQTGAPRGAIPFISIVRLRRSRNCSSFWTPQSGPKAWRETLGTSRDPTWDNFLTNNGEWAELNSVSPCFPLLPLVRFYFIWVFVNWCQFSIWLERS